MEKSLRKKMTLLICNRNNITSLIQVNTNQYLVDAFGGISNLDVI